MNMPNKEKFYGDFTGRIVFYKKELIAVLRSTVGYASKLCMVVLFTVSGQIPCSGAERQGKELGVVSTAIHGDEVDMNVELSGARSLASARTAG